MELTINPDYEYLREFVEQLPCVFEKTGRVIYQGRNLIKVMDVDGLEINVKQYRIPSVLNRFVYTFFRLPKGRRAFLFPKYLLDKGFETPIPIAYIEEKSFGLIRKSYFVSMQSPYKRNFYEFGDADVETCIDVIKAFSLFTARLHEAGILHLDYSPGNILFDKIDGKYHFSLVDINRMRFDQVSIKQGCANFARLWGQVPLFELIAEEYAQARNFDKGYCRKLVLLYRRKFWTNFKKKHAVKFHLEI